MTETPPTWPIENKQKNEELKNQINSSILKLFFKKEVKKSAESTENPQQEININIQWSIKWPDKFWNYVMSFDGKKILLDENLNDITWLEFVGIMPYDDRYYVGDVWQKCVFYDMQSWKVVEFAEVWSEVRPKIYEKDELSNDEFLADVCAKSIKLFPGESEKMLVVWFYAFLNKYYQHIIWKNIDIESKMHEASKFGEECKQIFSFLMWTYEYMYNGKITNFLAWKDSEIRQKLKESETLKEMYPDLYLTMHGLDFIKNVLINKEWEVCGYVIVKNWICSYVQIDWTVSQYDDFIWPDKYGNIITKQWDKQYFMNSAFQYPFCWFDKINWPDKNGNYILKLKNKRCIVPKNTWNIFSISGVIANWNEPDFTNECFDQIQWPDENNNYIIKSSRWYFLLNGKWEKISDFYWKIESEAKIWGYKVLTLSWISSLDKDWKMV